jgi:acyl-lipid (8-3)-desaturase
MGSYTRAEVAKHVDEEDLWLIIKNRGSDRHKVYDVSSYVPSHPGGDTIFRRAGKDSTEGFMGPQHPITTSDLLEEYCIGELID